MMKHWLLLVTGLTSVNGWVSGPACCSSSRWCHGVHPLPFTSKGSAVTLNSVDDVVDADIEDFRRTVKYGESTNHDDQEPSPLDDNARPKSLVDLSLESGDPRWKETRVPFYMGQEAIDGKLAFTVELEGVQYGIAVPFDDAVAIVVETRTNPSQQSWKPVNPPDDIQVDVRLVNPDNPEHEDDVGLMEIMATHVREQLGEELALCKTPKVLTVTGGLHKVTDNFEQELTPEPVTAEGLLDDDSKLDEDEEVASFLEFMKKELGEEEFEKTKDEELSDEDLELLEYFEAIPGLGTAQDDVEGIQELVESMKADLGAGEVTEANEFEFDKEGLALRLLSFDFGDGSKSYTLVKLLEPYMLLGKYQGMDGNEEGTPEMRFDLLTPEEEQLVVPRLEELCEDELKAAGLSFKKRQWSSSASP